MDNIFYSEIRGRFHTRVPSKGKEVLGYALIAENVDGFLSSAFCTWCSRKRDLSNQFDKPWEYVGKKAKLKDVQQDWIDFMDAHHWMHEFAATRPQIEEREGGSEV